MINFYFHQSVLKSKENKTNTKKEKQPLFKVIQYVVVGLTLLQTKKKLFL